MLLVHASKLLFVCFVTVNVVHWIIEIQLVTQWAHSIEHSESPAKRFLLLLWFFDKTFSPHADPREEFTIGLRDAF